MSRSDDDQLVIGDQAPRWVRWAAWSLAGVLAAVLAGVLVSRHHGAPTAPAHPPPVAMSSSVAASRVASSRVASSHVATSRVASSRVQYPPEPPYTAAVAQAGDVRWEVQGATLYVETAVDPGHFVRAIDLPSAFAAPASEPEMALDPVSGDAWVVLAHSRPSFMIRVSLSQARIVRQVRWATSVTCAAAYAGHLYLSTGQGIADLAPHAAQPRPVPGLAGATGEVVADPSRHRLIAIAPGSAAWLWTFSPHAAPAGARVHPPVQGATITVVNGAIWLLGRVGDDAVLERLDPTTLRPTGLLQLPAHVNAHAVLLPGSERALWLSGPPDRGRLVCANAQSGAELQTWPISGANSVAARHGSALIALDGRFQTIDLHRCDA